MCHHQSSRHRCRSRPWYGLGILSVIVAGLLLRANLLPFFIPHFIAKYGGDALWAVVVLLGVGLVIPGGSTLRVGLISVGLSWAVEFSQLYHSPWIDGIRSTRFGHWVLGAVFHAPDLLAYLIGIALGALAEWMRGGSSGAEPPVVGGAEFKSKGTSPG